MAEHEVIALQVSFNAWLKDRASGLKVEPFLYYSVEHITKQFDLTDEEINYGITDHINDGGIDAVYCLAGKANKLIRDDVKVTIAGADSIRIMVFQSKSSLSETGFKSDDIDAFARFTDALLSLKRPATDFSGIYQTRILTIMQIFKDRYLEVVGNNPRLILEFYYITRGDGEILNIPAQEAVKRLHEAVTKHRGPHTADSVTFFPVDTPKLLEYVRQRRQRSRALKWTYTPMTVADSNVHPPRLEGYIGLVKLMDYYAFLKNSRGDLDELIFESNVRGHQGRTSVNKGMRTSLDDGGPTDFWKFNNGITITCTGVDPIDVSSVQVHDPQVVNGLQTSRVLFAYCTDNKDKPETRTVLIKLIPVSQDTVRDQIIRATNNQNRLGASALRTTDNRHREIEDLFKDYDLFYDRRPGFYKDAGKAIDSIISVTEVVQAIVALVLHQPDDSRGRPGDYVKEGKAGDEKYKLVFGTKTRPAVPLGAYFKCIQIIREVRDYLWSLEDLSPGDRTNLLFYVAYVAVCEQCKSAYPTAESILGIESGALTNNHIEAAFKAVDALYITLSEKEENPDIVARGTELLGHIQAALFEKYGTGAPAPIVTRKYTRRKRPKDIIADSKIEKLDL